MDFVDSVRDFNRFYTRQIGLVGRDPANGNLNLSELRVLYELGQENPPTARLLAIDLGLDEGYLSRILAKFLKKGWLVRTPDIKDRRISKLSLSASGMDQIHLFTDEMRTQIRGVFAGNDQLDRDRIRKAMGTIRNLICDGSNEVSIRNLKVGDSGWLIQQHAEIYHNEYGLDASFEALVAEILAGYIKDHDPASERAFIAERDGQRLGSVFCMRQSATVAKLRLFILVPEARGLGIGKMLLEACIGFAREQGYEKVVLWTIEDLKAACALYERYGFVKTASEASNDFGINVVNATYELEL